MLGAPRYPVKPCGHLDCGTEPGDMCSMCRTDPPRCCPDAVDGGMSWVGDRWVCAWCDEEFCPGVAGVENTSWAAIDDVLRGGSPARIVAALGHSAPPDEADDE